MKTRGNSRLRLLVLAAGWLAACASTSGGGTNTNWTECETREDCESGALCVDRRCVASDAGPAAGGGGGGRGSGGGGGGGEPACPLYADWPPPGATSEPYQGRPSDFSAETFGCYPSRRVADGPWTAEGPDCRGNTRCTYEPGDLPCGPCSPQDEACTMGVWAACNCGDGPFLQSYTDQWACQCMDGQWDCRIVAPSGASCQDACGGAGGSAGGSNAGGAGGSNTGGAGGSNAG